jgi:hypothetical protein
LVAVSEIFVKVREIFRKTLFLKISVEVSGIFVAEKFFQKKVMKQFIETEFSRVFTYAL